MSTIFNTLRTIVLLALITSPFFANIASAQISTYDSMYFPTTQSLEGTRGAPRIYEVISFEFGSNTNTSAKYFDTIKTAYFDDTKHSFETFNQRSDSSENTILMFTNAPSVLSPLHHRALARYSVSNYHSVHSEVLSNELRQIGSDNAFNFRNGDHISASITLANLN